MGILSASCKLGKIVTKICNFFSHFVNFGVRYYLFTVFFFSGLLKTKSWESTLALFQYEYNVTWLPLPPPIIEKFNLTIPAMDPVFAAYLGTAAEIILPILLLIGIFGRIPAIILFIFNYTALVSYPFLWTNNGIAGYMDHMFWGALIGYSLFYGYGAISLDCIVKKFKKC